MGRKRPALGEQLMRVGDCLQWWQRFRQHRLDAFAAVGQRPTESITRTRLPCSALRVTITILAAGTARQELRELRIRGYESVSLLTAIAAVETDGDRLALAAEHPPHTTRVLPAAELGDEVRDGLHGTCIPATKSYAASRRDVVARPGSLGRNVIEDGPGVSGALIMWIRQVRPSSASTVAASAQANCSPIHIRGPAPNGRNAPRGWPGVFGSKRSGCPACGRNQR